MKVLVRVPNWIGDAVLSLRALEEYRRENPGHRLWVLARPWVADVFQGLDWISGTISYLESPGVRRMGPRLSLAGFRRLSAGLRAHSFDRALLFQNSMESALLARMAGIPERIGYRLQLRRLLLTRAPRVRIRRTPLLERFGRRLGMRLSSDPGGWWPRRRGSRDHEVKYYLDLLYQAGLISTDYLSSDRPVGSARIQPSSEGMSRAGRLLAEKGLGQSPFLLINPGSAYGSAKRWSPASFAELIERTGQDPGIPAVILGWGSDRKLAEEIASLAPPGAAHVLSGPPDLARTTGLVARSRLLITNDSGLMHLAAALNHPQIALFGSTDPVSTGPLSSAARVIWKGVHCSPCHLRECPLDRRCWNSITPAEVAELLAGKS